MFETYPLLLHDQTFDFLSRVKTIFFIFIFMNDM